MQYYDNDIQTKYPLLYKYFKSAIMSKEKNLGHLLLFWGADISAQCAIANEIARMLNCNEEKDLNCTCVNCKGIKENEHEAFKIYTRLDFKDPIKNSENENTGKKNISMQQVQSIINDVALSSVYHRVYVFCDRDEDGKLLPLNKMNFPDTTANALLKTFEEPNHKTTFIILTKNPADVISTVVSRSQTFFVPFVGNKSLDFRLVTGIVSNYWTLPKEEVFELADTIFNLTSDNDIKDILLEVQNYIYNQAVINSKDKVIFNKFLKDLKIVEEAVRQSNLPAPGIQPRVIVDNMCYKLLLS